MVESRLREILELVKNSGKDLFDEDWQRRSMTVEEAIPEIESLIKQARVSGMEEVEKKWIKRFSNSNWSDKDLIKQAVDAQVKNIQEVVDSQSEDEGLWFIARTAPEAYLQQELRKLHLAIESQLKDGK